LGTRGRIYVVRSYLEVAFPNLQGTGYDITSPATPDYNCIAWAAGDTARWWWPNPWFYYWPQGSPLEETLAAFVQAFATLGFIPCDDDTVEPGFEKIAIYVNSQGKPTHAARQLHNGRWSSKLGREVDIEHSLVGLTNSEYGSVAQILKRPFEAS
jgi:hypothetical protein